MASGRHHLREVSGLLDPPQAGQHALNLSQAMPESDGVAELPLKRFTLPRGRRIRSPLDFQRLRAKGRRMQTHSLVFWVDPSPTGPRLGLAVSRKVGGAVLRNRVKRLLRECFRRMQWELPAFDFLVAPKRAVSSWSFEALSREWHQLAAQIRSAGP
jgi:ribonuclease P protein component